MSRLLVLIVCLASLLALLQAAPYDMTRIQKVLNDLSGAAKRDAFHYAPYERSDFYWR